MTVGQTFSLAIKTNSAASQPIAGVQAVINFDPTKLEVIDADTGKPGVQISPGADLPVILMNRADNEKGKIEYAAGKLGEPFPAGSLAVASIQFRARAPTSPVTPVAFYFEPGLGTDVVFESSIQGKHADAAVTITP